MISPQFIARISHAISRKNPRNRVNRAAIFAVLLSPLLFLALLSYAQIYATLTDLAFARRQSTTVASALLLKEKLDRLVDLGIFFSLHPKLRSAVAGGRWEEAIDILALSKTLTEEPFIDRIFLADPRGIAKALTPPDSAVIGKDFSFRDWYEGVVSTGKPYVSIVYERLSTPVYNVVAAAVPLISDDQKLTAILGFQIRLDRFLEWSGDIDVGPRGFVYIVDQKGQLVAHPKYPSQGSIIDFSGVSAVMKILNKERGVEVTYNPIEEEMISAYEPVAKYGWGVIAQQPTRDAFASRTAVSRLLIVIYLLIFAINGFLVSLILRIITHYQDHRD